ncbi:MAG: AMP-binding protein [Deltaproteobacteria bacterium]|nr:AMP-binding protein [Deltaproteobacteria bacterium]PWB60771.1 MAG: AMP-dependent synthetase [Deltaproteobacteria bacterium]
MNLGTLLPRHARYRPDHTAVIFEEQRLTFDQFHRRVNRIANALLSEGISKGDKIATVLPNCLELLEVYWAVAAIGAVVVPLSPLLRGKGLSTLLSDSDSEMVITNAAFVEHLDPVRAELPRIRPGRYLLIDADGIPGYRSYGAMASSASDAPPPAVPIGRDDPYNIIYSSGTTGMPKGIVHSHYVRGMYGTVFSSAYRITPESVLLHAGSIVFNGSFLTLMPAMYLGATLILQRQFQAEEFLRTVERERVTHVILVPSQIIALLNDPHFSPKALESLETVCSLGAPLHREHKERLARELPGRFHELYGLTEGFVTILDKNDYAAKPGSVGSPPPFFEMRISDESGRELPAGQVGEITGRGPILMSGYYKRPDLTREAVVDGWLRSGDLGYVDAEGYLYLVDRMKDLILSGGINVYPKDIEEVIAKHPAVREAAVFGAPSEKWGETPVAAVILSRPGAAAPEEIREWVNARVEARYQQVREVVILADFPRNAAGKTLKRVLRERFWAGRDTRI